MMDLIHFLLDFLKDPLTVLERFLAEYQNLTYGILFLVIFVETGLIVMPFLPGDSLLFAIGLLAATTGKIELIIIIPLLILAALLGDNVNYFIGKKFSDFVKSKDKILFLKREHIQQTEEFYKKQGGKAVILARFVPIVRTVAPFVAGAGNMQYGKYITYCIIGAIFWVSGITFLGYFLGNFDIIKNNFEKVVLGIVFVSVLPMIWGVVKSKFKNKIAQ